MQNQSKREITFDTQLKHFPCNIVETRYLTQKSHKLSVKTEQEMFASLSAHMWDK